MRATFYARLVCPDDPEDCIFYGTRADVPQHLEEPLRQLEDWAATPADWVRTECGDLQAGPGLLEGKGISTADLPVVRVPLVEVEARAHPLLGHVLIFPAGRAPWVAG